MSRVKGSKKGKKNPAGKAIYQELPSLKAETPQEMLSKLGGVAGHATQEQPGGTHLQLASAAEHRLPGLDLGVVSPHNLSHSLDHLKDLTATEHDQEHSNLGSSQVGEPSWEQAEQAAQAAHNAGHYNQAAADYIQAGQDLTNAGHYNQAAGAYENAANMYACVVNIRGDQSAQAFENIAGAYNDAGYAYSSAGHNNEAAQAFVNAAGNYSNMVNISGDTSNGVFNRIAEANMNAGGQYNEVANYSEAVNCFSNAASNFVHIGANLGAGQAFAAEAQANLNGGYGWQTPVNFQNAGHYFALSGDLKDAASNYADASANYESEGGHDGNVAHCARLAGQYYLQLGNDGEALSMFQRAINHYGSSDYQQLGECYQGLGQSCLRFNEGSQAAAAFSQAGQSFASGGHNNEAASAYSSAGQTYMTLNNYSQAVTAYKSASQAYSNAGDNLGNAQAEGNVAQAYSYQAKADVSGGHYEQAAQAFQNAGQHFYNADQCYNRADDPSAAQQVWSEAGQAYQNAGQNFIMDILNKPDTPKWHAENDLSYAMNAFTTGAGFYAGDKTALQSFWYGAAGSFGRACTHLANQGQHNVSAYAQTLEIECQQNAKNA